MSHDRDAAADLDSNAPAEFSPGGVSGELVRRSHRVLAVRLFKTRKSEDLFVGRLQGLHQESRVCGWKKKQQGRRKEKSELQKTKRFKDKETHEK